MHLGVEVTESSTNKQHHLDHRLLECHERGRHDDDCVHHVQSGIAIDLHKTVEVRQHLARPHAAAAGNEGVEQRVYFEKMLVAKLGLQLCV